MIPGGEIRPGSFYRKDEDMEDKEVVLTSIEQFRDYLKENADNKNIISVVLELTGREIKEGGGESG